MFKQVFLILSLLSLFSCHKKLFIDQVDKSKFCNYFTIETGSAVIDGKKHTTASTRINKQPDDEVSDFIQNHTHRFDYLVNKIFMALLNAGNNFDSVDINKKFCNAISADSFFQHFTLLTSGERHKNVRSVSFSVPELMSIASRFFMCDNIRQKDTSISSHICVTLNGIADLRVNRDYTVLEAFCFEAIFRNLGGKPKFLNNFFAYVKNSTDRNKNQYRDLPSLLIKVRDECYADMEKDKDLEDVLLNYYQQNKDNINFKIE